MHRTGSPASWLYALVTVLLVAKQGAAPQPLALPHVTVVDVRDGELYRDQTVVIRGNRITAVGPPGSTAVPGGARVIDGRGRYLIPGLWDAHVHSAASEAWHFPLLVGHGVTSVRNMHTTVGAALSSTNAIKRRLAKHELLGPRFIANGPMLDGEPPAWRGTIVVRNAAEGRQAVRSLADGGADFIKVYDNLTRETYFAILDEARRRGIPVDGHVPFRVDPQEAADAGQRTVEHLLEMAFGCSRALDTVRDDSERDVRAYASMSFSEQMLIPFRRERRLYDSRDPDACVATVEALRRGGVAVVPTLVVGHNNLNAHQVFADTASLRLIPEETRRQWREQAGSELSLQINSLMRPTRPAVLQNVRLLNEGGVSILAGTDLGNPMLVPGISLHQELALLVEAGLSPLQALQAATRNPARVFGVADSRGIVTVGKLADLVLLDANPLEDIRNTRRITAVVLDGRYLDRAALDHLLAAPERAASPRSDSLVYRTLRPPNLDIYLFDKLAAARRIAFSRQLMTA